MDTDRKDGLRPRAVPMLSDKFIRRVPARPQQLVENITPVRDVFVLAHVGVPQVDMASWRLEIAGMVEHPAILSFDALRQLPKIEVQAFHQCAGFPLNPKLATRRIANVVWGGVSLATVLARTGLDPGAKFVWAYGLDHGVYHGVEIHAYVKDIPLERLGADELLLAYEMNGAPLPQENGFPLRLVAPGFYGTNSVKWLCRIELAATRASGPFTEKFYNDPVMSARGTPTGAVQPLWEAPPESLIVAPAHGARLSGEVTIWGRAWAFEGVASVEVSSDGGRTWQRAELSRRIQHSWQTFHLLWQPRQRGTYLLAARATDCRGGIQAHADARNAVHHIQVDVVDL